MNYIEQELRRQRSVLTRLLGGEAKEAERMAAETEREQAQSLGDEDTPAAETGLREADLTVPERLPAARSAQNRAAARSAGGAQAAETMLWRKRGVSDPGRAAPADGAADGGDVLLGRSRNGDFIGVPVPQALSRAFERDARRYNGEYPLYG